MSPAWCHRYAVPSMRRPSPGGQAAGHRDPLLTQAHHHTLQAASAANAFCSAVLGLQTDDEQCHNLRGSQLYQGQTLLRLCAISLVYVYFHGAM